MGSIDGYRLIRSVGSSAAGTVYAAETSQGLVAIRQHVPLTGPESPFWQSDRDRFLAAGRQALTLNHPRIVTVLEVIDEAGEAFITSEFVDAETLQTALASRRFSMEEANTILSEIARALDFAHDRGVVHGDLKPSEIYLTPLGVKIADFGISPLAHWDAGRTLPANLVHGFLSPEHLRNTAAIDARSDQYALGMIAYWLYTGQAPYGRTAADSGAASLSSDLLPPTRVDPRLPPSFDSPILRALEREPERRFDSCRSFVGSLGAGLIATSEPGQKKRSFALLAVGLALPLLGAVGYVALKDKPPPPPVEQPKPIKVEPDFPPPPPPPATKEIRSKPVVPDPVRPPKGNPFDSTKKPEVRTRPTEPDRPVLPTPRQQPPPPNPAAGYSIQVFSRENALREGQQFALMDPRLGELAYGDLKAMVNGGKPPSARTKLRLEWWVGGVRHDSTSLKIDDLVPFHNQPASGNYEVRLTVDGNTVRTFSFQITP